MVFVRADEGARWAQVMKRMAEVRGTWKQRAPKRNPNLVSEFKRSDKQLAAKSAGRIKQRGGLPDLPPTQALLSPLCHASQSARLPGTHGPW